MQVWVRNVQVQNQWSDEGKDWNLYLLYFPRPLRFPDPYPAPISARPFFLTCLLRPPLPRNCLPMLPQDCRLSRTLFHFRNCIGCASGRIRCWAAISSSDTSPRTNRASVGGKLGTERVGSDFGGEGCSTFYLEVTGAVLIRETQTEEMQFQYKFRSRILSFPSARSSWPNYPSAMPNSLPTATVFLCKIRPFRRLRSGWHSSPFAAVDKKGRFQSWLSGSRVPPRQNHKRKNHEKLQTPTPGSTVRTQESTSLATPYVTLVVLPLLRTERAGELLWSNFWGCLISLRGMQMFSIPHWRPAG